MVDRPSRKHPTPVQKRVVHDRCEEIDRLYEGAIWTDAINRGVIRGRSAHQQIRVFKLWELMQDLHQRLLAELGGSTGAG
jgi:hypothetical protein